MQGVKELATLWTLLLWFVTDFVPGDFQQGQETLVEVVGLQVLLLVVNVLSLGLSPPFSGLLFSLLPGIEGEVTVVYSSGPILGWPSESLGDCVDLCFENLWSK